MVNSVKNIIADSLFCSPEQFDTPGRILVTDCYWTTAFENCAQFFQLNSRFIFVIPFRWAALFQPILEKIRVGSGMDPQMVLKLLSDRKKFENLCIEGITDLFINCNNVHRLDKPADLWCQAYPVKYSRWLFLDHEFKLHLANDLGFDSDCLWGVDARQVSGVESLICIINELNKTNSCHLLLSTDSTSAIQPIINERHLLVTRYKISW